MGFLSRISKRIGRAYAVVTTDPYRAVRTASETYQLVKQAPKMAIQGAQILGDRARKVAEREVISLAEQGGRVAVESAYDTVEETLGGDPQERLIDLAEEAGEAAMGGAYTELGKRIGGDPVERIPALVREAGEYATRPIKSTVTTIALLGGLFLAGYVLYRALFGD